MDPNGFPSSKKLTEAMPTVEVGFATTVIVEVTVAPFEGAVMETETPVAETVSVTGNRTGDPAALLSDIVAVAV